jgi:hypothetical protein
LKSSYASPDHYYLSIASELTSTNLALVHSSCHSLRNMSGAAAAGLAGEVNSFTGRPAPAVAEIQGFIEQR